MTFEEKQINSKIIYDGKILRLEVDDVILPDGKVAKRECVRHSGGAAVLFIKDEKIALVKQFRYLYGKELYEIPAGKVNLGEEACVSAARELQEETGYKATKLTSLGAIYPSPGYTDEIIYIYLADSATYVGQNLDDGEFLNCEFFDIDEVLNMINSGEICDAKTVLAVYKYLLSANK
jgi:ADP-ribose pyrophosphatase